MRSVFRYVDALRLSLGGGRQRKVAGVLMKDDVFMWPMMAKSI